MRHLRQTPQHEADIETSQGAAAHSATEQRSLQPLPQSVQDVKFPKQSQKHLSPEAEVVLDSNKTKKINNLYYAPCISRRPCCRNIYIYYIYIDPLIYDYYYYIVR